MEWNPFVSLTLDWFSTGYIFLGNYGLKLLIQNIGAFSRQLWPGTTVQGSKESREVV